MKKENKLLRRTILSLMISSLALLVGLLVFDPHGDIRWKRVVGFVLIAAFYVFLIAGYWCFFLFSKRRKQNEKNNRAGRRQKKKLPGIIVFFSNRSAAIADLAMIVSFLATVTLIIIRDLSLARDPVASIRALEWLLFPPIAIFVFSAQMHSILNGVNYRYYLDTKDTEDIDLKNTSRHHRSEWEDV